MADVKNCLLPDDLYYHVEHNVWLRDKGDGTWDLGMTDIAQSMAGALLHCRAKKVGKAVKEGKSLATVESGKWVGPLKAPFACEIVAHNEDVATDATVLNRSPYKQGWIIRVKPSEGVDATAALVSGEAAVEAFRKYMEEHELAECIHCEGFDG
jgi:glycine cleavage system H protein